MRIEQFSCLDYTQQLQLINRSGKFRKTRIVGDYQFTVFKVGAFYVVLKRNIRELLFEQITAMSYDDLPAIYK